MIIIWFSAEGILLFLNQEPEVAHMAAICSFCSFLSLIELVWTDWSGTYPDLRHLAIGLPGYGLNCLLKRFFQSQSLLHIPTIVIFIVAPLNLLLNYALVFGFPFLPRSLVLGFRGAPLATGIAMDVEALLFLAAAWKWGDARAWKGWDFGEARRKLGSVTRLAIASVGMVGSEWWAWEVVALAASQLGGASFYLGRRESDLTGLRSSDGARDAVHSPHLL